MHMVVTTPLGQIKTRERNLCEEEWEQSIEGMKQINTLGYIQLDTEEGVIFMSKGMIQSSLFAMVKS